MSTSRSYRSQERFAALPARFRDARKRQNAQPLLEALEDRTLLAVSLLSHYLGLNAGAMNAGRPGNPTGAAGPTNYVETVNDSVSIFTPKTTGAAVATDTLNDFWFTQGGLIVNAFNSVTNRAPFTIYDEQVQRFFVAEQFGDGGVGDSQLFLAVSQSASPTTLTAGSWIFNSISIPQEIGFATDGEAIGNVGYNHDALVFTLNMFSQQSPNPLPTHVQVISISMSDLVNGVASPRLFSNDFSSATADPKLGTLNFRATVMHDAVAGDPMWLVGEGPNPSVDVVKMTVLTNAPSFTETLLTVNPYTGPIFFPVQPDGSIITDISNSSIQKAAETNHTLVATHSVGVGSSEVDARWYRINVNGPSPVLADQGNVGNGNNTYSLFPVIDINASGAIGLGYMQTGTGTGQFLSVDITGRLASDPTGTMETPVVVQPGAQNYHDHGEGTNTQLLGTYSGINVDADGSIWIVSEFADNEPPFPMGFANWGTAIGHFNFGQAVTPPLVMPPSDQPASEGALTSFTLGSFSDSGGNGPWTGTVNWGDNTTSPLAITMTGSLGSQSHAYAEQGIFTVTIAVTDTGDGQQGSTTFKVTVADLAVVKGLPLTFSATEGTAFSNQAVATFSDPAGAEAVADYSASIDWGDTTTTSGTIGLSNGTFTVSANHTYTEEGPFSLIITVMHESTTPTAIAASANVAEQAVLGTPGTVNASAGTPFSGTVATFTDPAGAEVTANYSASIDWGDMTPTTSGMISVTNGTFTVTGSHTYASTSTPTIAITLSHEGTTTPVQVHATVSTAPVVTPPQDQTANEGAATSFTLGSFSDAANGPWTGSVDWGDGSMTPLTITAKGSLGSQMHTYAEEGGPVTITVTVNDTGDNQHGSNTFKVTVAEQALVAGPALTLTPSEGSALSNQIVATFTDPAGAEVTANYSASIAWGDNTTTTGTISVTNGTFSVLGSHTYAEEGPFSITATLSHETAASLPLTALVTVSDPAVLGTPGTLSVTVGQPFSGSVATFTDPGGAESTPSLAAHYTATIDWGDTTTTTGTLSLNNGTFSVSGSHTYATAGNPTVKVSFNHEGITNAVQFQATVNPNIPPPQVTVPAGQNALEGGAPTVGTAQPFNLGSFTDANPNSGPWTVTASWGDGTPDTTFPMTTQGSLGFQSHVYAEEGTATLSVRVTDSLGSSGSGTSQITIADPAVKPVTVVFLARPGVPLTNAVVSTFSDPGGAELSPTVAAHYLALIVWGDQTPLTLGSISASNGVFTVSGSHTYASGGVFFLLAFVFHETSTPAVGVSLALVLGVPGGGAAAAAGPSPLSPAQGTTMTAVVAGTLSATPNRPAATRSISPLSANPNPSGIPLLAASSMPELPAGSPSRLAALVQVFSDLEATAFWEAGLPWRSWNNLAFSWPAEQTLHSPVGTGSAA